MQKLISCLVLLVATCLGPSATYAGNAAPLDAQAEPYDPARGIPSGYHLEQGVRKWLVFSGLGLFGASYGMVLVKATGPGQTDNETLLLPFAGPFILAIRDGDPVKAVVGAGQIIGAAAFVLGLKMKVPWIVPDEQSTAYVGPMRIGRSGYGGGLSLRF